MTRANRAIAISLLLLWGCGAPDPAGPTTVGIAGDERFRLEVRTQGTPEAGEIEVEVTPRGEWHLALDAPARVRFESERDDPGPCAPTPAQIERAEASEASEAKLYFEARWAGDEACQAVEGALKFGLCFDDSEQCSIVRERFALKPCTQGLCPEES